MEHPDSPNESDSFNGDDAARRREEKWERDRESHHGRRPRKERVLHTRISEQLSEDIRALADEMRVPVSNLVRNVLEEAFNVVEEVTGDVGDILEDVMDQAEQAAERIRRGQLRRRARARRGADPAAPARQSAPEAPAPRESGGEEPPDLSEVVAWQPVILNVPQHCARTGREIRAGEEAFMGLTAGGFSGLYLSREGLDLLR